MNFQKTILFVFLLTLFLSTLSFVLLSPQPTLAQDWRIIEEELGKVGEIGFGETGLPESPAVIVGRIIRVALGLLGIIFVGLTTYGGFLWMTSGGNEENVKKAKTLITNGIIGLLIIVTAYAITYFVTRSIAETVLPYQS